MRTWLQGPSLDYRLVSVAPPVDPVEAQSAREVRVSVYVDRVLRRWYVVLAAIVVAVLLVVLRGASPAHTTEGTATVYLGQPVTPGGGTTYANPPFGSLSSAQTVATSDAVLQAAASAAGVPVGSLHGHVAVHLAGGAAALGAKTTGGPVTAQVIAQGSWAHVRTARVIAAVIAHAVQRSANTYQTVKATQYAQQIATEQQEVTALRQNMAAASSEIARLGSNPSGNSAIALAVLLNQRSSDADLLGTTQNALAGDRVALASVRTVESAQIIGAPVGRTVTATTRRSSFVIAAFIGLIVGCLLALGWEAMRQPRAARPMNG